MLAATLQGGVEGLSAVYQGVTHPSVCIQTLVWVTSPIPNLVCWVPTIYVLQATSNLGRVDSKCCARPDRWGWGIGVREGGGICKSPSPSLVRGW